jgi:uncharacterized membrane protein (DUF2068 family)
LLIGAGVRAAPAAMTLIAGFGLWKGRFWGWLLSLATDVGMLGVLVYSIIDDNEVDGELIALTGRRNRGAASSPPRLFALSG